MEKALNLDAGKYVGEARRLSGENVDEELIDHLIGQIRSADIPDKGAALLVLLYRHSMVAPRAVHPGNLEALRDRTPGIARLGQGFEGIVEILSEVDSGICLKRRYAIGDRKERKEHLRKRYSYKQEFEFHKRTFDLGAKVPRPLSYTEVIVRNASGKKIADLSTEFILMEAIPAWTLLDFTPDQVQDADALQMAFDGLKENLETLHRNNIYHGDLGLKNMMIVEYLAENKVTYAIYIIDFGRAYDATEDMFANGRVPDAKTDDELYQHARAKFFGV